jgi:hypothetical protein
MVSMALMFAAPVAAADLLDQVERMVPDERPGAVVRGTGGIIDPTDSIRIKPGLDLWFQGDIERSPEYWPVQTTRYRVATLTNGDGWNRPEDLVGIVGGLSNTSETRFGPILEQSAAVGGFYGWQLAPNLTLQADLQYLMQGPDPLENERSGMLMGLNLQYEF